jgi:hypothetical protein
VPVLRVSVHRAAADSVRRLLATCAAAAAPVLVSTLRVPGLLVGRDASALPDTQPVVLAAGVGDRHAPARHHPDGAWSTMKRNYHMSVACLADGRARCDYCGCVARDFNELAAGECTHVYKPCTSCGGDPDSNECKADCPEMLGLLFGLQRDPSVHIVGEIPGKEPAKA